jgi:hypothetical protein
MYFCSGRLMHFCSGVDKSRIIAKRQQIERELRQGVRDPRRKIFLIHRLIQLERECAAMSFTEAEVKTNDIGYGKTGEVRSQTNYITLPSWVAADSSDQQKMQQAGQKPPINGPTSMQAHRAEMLARLAELEAQEKSSIFRKQKGQN